VYPSPILNIEDAFLKCILLLVRVEGLEPTHLAALDPKSSVSTNFTTPAIFKINKRTPSLKRIAKINFFGFLNHNLFDY
jgi:hypothetical protein